MATDMYLYQQQQRIVYFMLCTVYWNSITGDNAVGRRARDDAVGRRAGDNAVGRRARDDAVGRRARDDAVGRRAGDDAVGRRVAGVQAPPGP